MSWNYGGDPSLNPRDSVRFKLGDTTPGKTPTLTDEEIDYLVREHGESAAAVEGAYALAARYAGMSATSKKVGDLQISYGHDANATRYEALAARLAKRGGPRTFAPIMVDSTPQAFGIGMDDWGSDWGAEA